MRAVAQWLVDAGYPFDFHFPECPPPLWDAIVDIIHEDRHGNYHGNELSREQVAAWLLDV